MKRVGLLVSLLSALGASCAGSPAPVPSSPPPTAEAHANAEVPKAEPPKAETTTAPAEPALRAGATGMALVAASYNGPNPCRIGGRGDSPVDKACNLGGVRAAKETMRELVRKGKAQGLRYQCDDCHSNPEDISQLNDTARDRFKQLVDAASKS